MSYHIVLFLRPNQHAMFHHSDQLSAEIPSSRFYERGKFGRIFPTLPPCQRGTSRDICDLKKIAQNVINSTESNPDIPAGYTYLGQFIGHDLSFDPTSFNERIIDPESLWNYRTPALDLDSIYGGGPSISPYLYDQDPSKGHGKIYFLLEKRKLIDGDLFDDVPRMSTVQRTAIIADPRNDDNIIISRIHSAVMCFHNKMVDNVIKRSKSSSTQNSPDEIFRAARQLVQWHYQWIVLYDYLPRIIDLSEHKDTPIKLTNAQNTFEKTFCARAQVKWMAEDKNKRKYYTWNHQPFIPLEFSLAAFRFGHSQVQKSYRFNPYIDCKNELFLFPIEYFISKEHFARVHYRFFFPDVGEIGLESNKIDPLIVDVMANLPVGVPKINLPFRNLVRGMQRNIPSGQDIAKAMGLKPLIIDDKSLLDDTTKGVHIEAQPKKFRPKFPEHLKANTPLWYYILYEAKKKNDGLRLGPVCSRIVAEVIIGLIQGDKTSFLNQDPNWVPTGKDDKPKPSFSMVDLLKIADIYENPSDPC